MRLETRKTAIAALLVCLVAGVAVFLLVSGGGDSRPTKDEVDGAYMRIAEGAVERTFTIDRATEDPPANRRRLAREFRGYAYNVSYTETYLQLGVHDFGPVGIRAFGLSRSLELYAVTLRDIIRDARRGARSFTRDFRWVREAGAEVRTAAAAWERALRVDLAS